MRRFYAMQGRYVGCCHLRYNAPGWRASLEGQIDPFKNNIQMNTFFLIFLKLN